MATVVVDACRVGATTAHETLGKDFVVVGTLGPALHVVAVRDRVEREVRRPVARGRQRRRHFRRHHQQNGG